jgi:uncharacterized protein involved in exopolysaccharide biosynthesis
MADIATVVASAGISFLTVAVPGMLFVNSQIAKLNTQMEAVLKRLDGSEGDEALTIASRATTEARLQQVESNTTKLSKINDDVVRLQVQTEALTKGQERMERGQTSIQRSIAELTGILQRKGVLFDPHPGE